MAEKARELRKKLSKDYANKIKNSNKDNNFPIRKAASNNIEHDPLKFFEQMHYEEKKQPDILHKILNLKGDQDIVEEELDDKEETDYEKKKPKSDKIFLNKKENPTMSEDKKNRLIQRMNTAVEFQKMKLGKALLKRTSEKKIEICKELEEKSGISQQEKIDNMTELNKMLDKKFKKKK
jgi:hypothetical protein